MKVLKISKEDAKKAYEIWSNDTSQEFNFNLSSDYIAIRESIVSLYKIAKDSANKSDDIRKDYFVDVDFGLFLYDYLQKQTWFNIRLVSDDSFWLFVSTKLIPDIVADRCGKAKVDYFWKQSNRLWPKSAWWYIHLTYQGSILNTQEILKSKRFNTDIKQGLVERSGRKGTYIKLYREIIRKYSLLDERTLIKFKKERIQGNDSLFRAIMRLNTAKCLVIDPCLYNDGIEGYVNSLLQDLNL